MPSDDPRIAAIPDIHGHAKGEHKPFAEERPIALTARMLFLWFYHACRRGSPRFLMVSDHMNYLTFEDPAAVNLVRRALKLAQAGDLYGAAETAGVDVAHAAAVSDGLRRGMRYSIGAEVDNDPRSRPDAQNIVDAMRPDGMIRSVHFLTIEHPQHGPNWNWAFDNEEFVGVFDIVGVEKTWELYMAQLLDAIERLPGNIVGHFYVPANFGHWPAQSVLEGYEDKMLQAAAARGMAIEFNTRFLYRDHPDELKMKYREAYQRLLRKAKAASVGIAVGSDAHSPRDQGAAFDEVLSMLDAADVNELVFPIGGRLARVALRATKEHLEQRAAAASIVVPGSSITGLGRAELGIDPNRLPEPKSAAASARERLAARAAKAAAAAKATAGPGAKATGRKGATAKPAAVAKAAPAAKPAAAAKAAPAAKAKPVAAKPAPAKKTAAAAPKAKTRPTPAPARPIAKKRPAAASVKPAARKSAPAKKAAPARKAAAAPARKLASAKPAAKKTAKPAAKPAAKRPAAAPARKKAAPAKKTPARKAPPKRR
jgi:HisJ family histidinol phosphate phosphatase